MKTFASDPVIEITFTAPGKDKFARLTENNINKTLGIVIDGKLVSSPVIKASISNGVAIIVGNFTLKEAEIIADGIIGK